MRRVLEALGARTGVALSVSGSAGDERLVAFAPDTPLVEVLSAAAELYRLEWTRSAGSRPAYRLSKPPGLARQEQALRDRALGELLDKLDERVRRPDVPSAPGPTDPWLAVYPEILPLVSAHRAALLREGYVYLPLRSLPRPQRDRIAAGMQPVLRQLDEGRRQAHRRLRSEWIEKGVPEAALEPEEPPFPPSTGEESTVTVDLHVDGGPRIEAGLRTHDGSTWYHWFGLHGDSLEEQGAQLYENRKPRIPSVPAGAGAAAEGPTGDPFHRIIEIPAAAARAAKGDWVGTLGRFSDASGLAIYTDCYHHLTRGVSDHPRGSAAAVEKASLAQLLDTLCFPAGSRGDAKLRPHGFWWRRDRTALVRSRRWLWQTMTVLPAELPEQLAAYVRSGGGIQPRTLQLLASLDAPQVHGLGHVSQRMDYWRQGVRIPALLSLPAQNLLLNGGFTLAQLSPADREMLTRLLAAAGAAPAPEGISYRAPFTKLLDEPSQGAPVLSFFYHWPGAPGGAVAHIPLPGHGPPPTLVPGGLQVERKNPPAP